MTGWLMVVVGFIYLGVSVGCLKANRPGMALAFAGYAVANAGFAFDLWMGK